TRSCRSPTRAWPSSTCARSRSASRATSPRGPTRSASCARWARAPFSSRPRTCPSTTRAPCWRRTTSSRWPTWPSACSSRRAWPTLIPLLSSVVQNLAQVGLPGALTGPVERGDVSTVEQHLRMLEAKAPDLLELYRLVGRDVLRLAQEKSKLPPETVKRLEG